ncbi:MAG TPA: DUF4388 domain-containing protein [bacterium]
MTSLEINLKEFTISDVLQFISRVKKTGVLRITGSLSGEIYLKDGLVVHAAAANGNEKGMEALFSMSFTELERGVFECGIMAPEQTISEDLGKLSDDLEKRRIEFEEIKKQMPPMDIALAKSTKELESAVALRRTDWQILALIDGKRTLAEVVAQAKLGGFEAIKTILWLKEKGLIYDPKEAERIMSGFLRYLEKTFEYFGKNGWEWLKAWAELDPANKNVANAVTVDEATFKVSLASLLSTEEIAGFFSRFDEFLNNEVPKAYGKLLAKKKMEEFRKKIEG